MVVAVLLVVVGPTTTNSTATNTLQHVEQLTNAKGNFFHDGW
jgi:hypothetical protein